MEHLLSLSDKELSDQFEDLNIADIVDFKKELSRMLNIPGDLLDGVDMASGKNNVDSIKFRKKADEIINKTVAKEFYKTFSLTVAGELYSKSIAYAEQNSADLIEAYANRSLVLYDLNFFTDCIRDIDVCLESSKCPDNIKQCLIERKDKCIKQLEEEKTNLRKKSTEESTETAETTEVKSEEVNIDLVNKNIEQSTETTETTKTTETTEVESEEEETDLIDINTEERTETTETTEVKSEEEKTDVIDAITEQSTESTDKSKLKDAFKAHPTIPCISEALDLFYNDEHKTRFLIANRDIKPDELLIYEPTYSKFITEFKYYTHCSHCLKKTFANIPCDTCIYNMFCSQTCKDEALAQYHDIECLAKKYMKNAVKRDQRFLKGMYELYNPGGLDLLTIDVFALKLTMLAIRECGGIDNLRKIIEEIDTQDPLVKGFCEDGIFRSNKYRALYSLTTHGRKRSFAETKLVLVETSFMMLLLNRASDIFKTEESIPFHKNEDVLFFGKIFAHNFLLLATHPIRFKESNKDKLITIASVIGPCFGSICHDNTFNTSKRSEFKDGELYELVFSVDPIAKGSQILHNYGAD